MEQLGKNWRVANTEVLPKKLQIPLNLLMEIKLKYCPYEIEDPTEERLKKLAEIIKET